MNYFSILMFLVALSVLNLLILLSLHLLDFSYVTSKQKIFFIRISLAIIGIVTFMFFTAQFFSFHTFEIIFPDKAINRLSVNSILPMTTKSYIDWAFYLCIAYTVGFCGALFRILFSYLMSRKQLISSSRYQLHGQSVFLNKEIQSPLSFGFPKGKIYVPVNLEAKWTPREIEICMAHEKIHIDQNDTFWKLLSLVVEALVFFAPWVYLLHKKFELEMEIFCDEQTRVRTNAGIQEYGDLLLTMTSIQPNNFLFTNIKTSTLKRRFLAMKSKNTPRPLLVAMLSIAILFAGGTAIAITDGVLMSIIRFKITSKIYIDGKLVSSPQIISYADQKATIILANKNENQGLKLTLVAKNIAKDNIQVNYDIQFDDGKEKVSSKPKMILIPNKEAMVRIRSGSGHSYVMKVIAERR